MPPETGVPFSRIYDQIMKYLQKNEKSLVIALDDVNYLFQSKNANKIFYDILRAYEEYPTVKTSILQFYLIWNLNMLLIKMLTLFLFLRK